MLSEKSEIKRFFKNQTVFITGGSGFLGKVLIEKLLRECEDVKKIYVLMRPKKGKSSEERFDEFFSYACFEVLKATNPDSFKKVSMVTGDCQLAFLGLSDQDIDILRKETTCVIHAAANVKFDQTLKEATYNVRATRDLLELAKQMLNLRVFVFVSTAFSNCLTNHIEEKFYPPPVKSEALFSMVNSLSEEVLEAITPGLLGKWPNTYVYTKCISEDLVKTFSEDLPLTIVRPGIVMNTASEPMPGWIDNFYGIVGIVAGAALGILRSINAKMDARAPIIPCDYVSNCVLAAAWYREKVGTTTIYNIIGHEKNRIIWKVFMEKVEPHCWAAASEKVLWYYCFKVRENETWHKICIFFLHTVPAYIVDFVFLCIGKPLIAVKSYRRLNKMLDLLAHFSTKDWDFEIESVKKLWGKMNNEDRKLFCFSMKHLEWDTFLHDSIFGARRHLLKDTLDTLPKGRRKLKKLFVAHYTVITILLFLLYKFIMFLLSLFL